MGAINTDNEYPNKDIKLTLPEAMQVMFACIKELNDRIKVIERRCPHVQGLLIPIPEDD